MLYRIRNGAKLFETAESRKYKTLSWVCVPNKHDGKGFRRVMKLKDAGNIYTAWQLMLQVGSKCQPRWTLADENGVPFTAEDLGDKTGFDASHFEKAFKVLSDKAIAWIEAVQSELINSDAPGINSDLNLNLVHNVTEQDSTRQTTICPTSAVVDAWNQLGKPFKRVAALTVKRKSRLRERLADKFFADNWKAALDIIKRSKFCRQETGGTWLANFDWFLKPDSVAKAMEGQYDDRKKNTGFVIEKDGTDPDIARTLKEIAEHPDDDPYEDLPEEMA